MNRVQKIYILTILMMLAGIGAVFYWSFLGPDHIVITARSLPELVESGELEPILIFLFILLIACLAPLPFLRFVFPREVKDGIEAQAKVLEVWDTRVTVNDNPQIGLLLEISPPGESPLQVKVKMVVSRLNAALVQPGIIADVRYDPRNPKRMRVLNLHIDGSDPGAASRLEELKSLRDDGLISAEEYKQKREEILRDL
ncbi:MAG: SHOCT domain-containing protein [Chloroflexi bacterium]|nr:SHOCT domain-containing protein [Chloroflexota bacterium]